MRISDNCNRHQKMESLGGSCFDASSTTARATFSNALA
jgi:hypothetical protein